MRHKYLPGLSMLLLRLWSIRLRKYVDYFCYCRIKIFFFKKKEVKIYSFCIDVLNVERLFHFVYSHQSFWNLILMFFIVHFFPIYLHRWTSTNFKWKYCRSLFVVQTFECYCFLFVYFAADQPRYNAQQIWHRWTWAKSQEWTRLAAWNQSATRH